MTNPVILSREEFWASKPAPGTRYVELSDSAIEVSACEIDVDAQEPDDIVAISFQTLKKPATDEDFVIVLHWGSWDTEAGRLAKQQHDEAVASMARDGESHNCEIGFAS